MQHYIMLSGYYKGIMCQNDNIKTTWFFTLQKHFSNLCIFSCYIEMLEGNVLVLSNHIFQKEILLPSQFHQKKIKLLSISLLGHTILSGIKMFSVEGKLSRIITAY